MIIQKYTKRDVVSDYKRYFYLFSNDCVNTEMITKIFCELFEKSSQRFDEKILDNWKERIWNTTLKQAMLRLDENMLLSNLFMELS